MLASDLRVRRGGNDILRGLDFAVSAGAITALPGPSGCGKTTLMRAVVGLQNVSDGAISVLGEPAGSANVKTHEQLKKLRIFRVQS